MLQNDGIEPGDADQAGELATPDQLRVERIGHHEQIPIGAGVGVSYQGLDFVGVQVAPCGLAAKLFVPKVVFVLVRRQIRRRDKLAAELLDRDDSYVGHHSPFLILGETVSHEDSRRNQKTQYRGGPLIG